VRGSFQETTPPEHYGCVVANHRGGGESSVIVTALLFLTTWTSVMTALWINNSGFDTDHRHRGGMLTKTPPPTELHIPATVTTLRIVVLVENVSTIK